MTSKRIGRIAAITIGCSGIISSEASAAARSSWTVSSGASYSRGDYGDISATKVLAVPFSLTFRRAGLKLRASLPWVHIEGPGSLIVTPEGRDAGGGGTASGGGSNSGSGSSNSGSGGSGGGGPGPSGGGGGEGSGGTVTGGTTTGGGTTTSGRRSGIGDLSLSATYSFDLGRNFYLEPGVKVKVPTASHRRNIGTGKTDVTLYADAVKELHGVTVYAGGRRRFTGKRTGSNLRSTWGAGAGASIRASRTVLVGADYDWQQSAIRGRGPSSEASAWVSTRLTRHARLTISGTKGFTHSSADYAAAAVISWRF